MKKYVAAAAQMCATDDVAENLATCTRLTEQAVQAGAALLVLPECFAFLGRSENDKFAIAENLAETGPIMSKLQRLAQDKQLWIIAGGIAETASRHPHNGAISRTYIASPVISPQGEIVANYRKIHLFDIDIPGGISHRESDVNAPGKQAVVAPTTLGRIGLSICYDLRFPELYRELVVQQNAQILTVPAAFTAHTGPAHWHVLLRSRAIENQCYVIAAAQYGQHNEKRASYGHSMIIDPWGTVLAELPDGEGLALAEIDLDALQQKRTQMPCLQHQSYGREWASP